MIEVYMTHDRCFQREKGQIETNQILPVFQHEEINS